MPYHHFGQQNEQKKSNIKNMSQPQTTTDQRFQMQKPTKNTLA
jgi:hypothetical protein